ncbi:hypothetical protein NDU88_008943 [Pleurodeles waltl]|uniref:Uncharacterized protein n=1 Tax=Pleurodeles waltl TaxID=8319 RepID=A0AAV7NZ88_PLEWA|nr:hypothetical protein NDU88_008943 [Pleurodeles waltl]
MGSTLYTQALKRIVGWVVHYTLRGAEAHCRMVQGPQGPPGRIPSAPETRAFSLRISVDSGRVAPGHEAPHQFDHSSRHFRGRTGPVRQGGPPGARPVSQECAGAQSGCPLHQRPPPPDTACRTQGRRHSKAPGSRAPRQAQGLRSFLLTCEGGAGGPARTPGRRHTVLRGLGNTRPSTSSPAATPRQEGGRPVSPAAVGWLPLKRRAVPRPAAYPLTRSVRLPTLTRRQAQGRGARRPPPTGSARLALGSTGARVPALAPRQFAPGGGPG